MSQWLALVVVETHLGHLYQTIYYEKKTCYNDNDDLNSPYHDYINFGRSLHYLCAVSH